MVTPFRLFALALLVAPAVAVAEECPTWLPDFRCERQARFEGFVQPMSMPYLFEDPFITTGANLVGIYHDFDKTGDFDAGYAGVLALQLRVALTDKLAFIATKDGFMMFRPDTKISDVPALGMPGNNRQLLSDEDAFLNATVGFKYALIEIPEQDFILTPAIRYEIPLGNDEVFQGHGDGLIIPSMSMAWGIDDFHAIAGLGGEVALDRDKDSSSVFYNVHLDYALGEHFVPFFEFNATHWVNSGDGSLALNTNGTAGVEVPLTAAQAVLRTGSFEGADVANLGSRGIAGDELVTLAYGLRVPLDDHLSLGVSYEHAVTGSKNLFQQRVTAMATYEY
jgi:hypothetical protein